MGDGLKRVLACPYLLTWQAKFHYVHLSHCWVLTEEGA